jgi:hypothetical protein
MSDIIRATLEVAIPAQDFDTFVAFVFHCADFFDPFHLGNWADLVAADKKRGLLIADMDSSESTRRALKAWKAGETLPEGFYAITKHTCLMAYLEGIKLYGMEWQHSSETDGRTYDQVFQMALFGSRKFG